MKIDNQVITEAKGAIAPERPEKPGFSPNVHSPATSQQPSISLQEARLTIDKATQLLQTIVTDKISDEVIRKIPADEYLHMLSKLDEMISGSLDDQA
ncbi:MAG: flagellar protein FlaG [Legionellaceae bacterium]|nr:flagellar protein FlaG [Legionellaceae bacterium]